MRSEGIEQRNKNKKNMKIHPPTLKTRLSKYKVLISSECLCVKCRWRANSSTNQFDTARQFKTKQEKENIVVHASISDADRSEYTLFSSILS